MAAVLKSTDTTVSPVMAATSVAAQNTQTGPVPATTTVSPLVVTSFASTASVAEGSQGQGDVKSAAEANQNTQLTPDGLSYVAHELRGQIGPIVDSIERAAKASTEMAALLEGLEGQGLPASLKAKIGELLRTQRKAHDVALDSATDQRTIADDLLGLQSLETGNVKLNLIAADPASIVNDVFERESSSLAKKGLTYSKTISFRDDMWVTVDPLRVRQILQNLVRNAIKFTAKGGTISNTLREIAADSSSSTLKFTVEDTGEGMDEAAQANIFKPFKQGAVDTAQKHGGTGLGLTISRRLAELMGGTLKLEKSEPGKGSTFALTLKCSKTPKHQPASPTLIPAPPSPLLFSVVSPGLSKLSAEQVVPQGTILIVEDGDISRRILEKLLRDKGYNYEIAKNGAEAVEMCAKKEYQGVLMDCVMPVMDGFTATQTIREKEKTGQISHRNYIIALTANVATDDFLKKVSDCGMDGYLLKPYQPKEVFEKLHGSPKRISPRLDTAAASATASF